MTSVINIVAHQDDDLYFMSPDILGDVDAAMADGVSKIGTFYLTAGDGGETWGSGYPSSRESGVKAAWASMAGVTNTWTDSTITLAGKTLATSTLAGTNIRLVFMRLHDGGFPSTGDPNQVNAYLMHLWNGDTTSLTSMDPAAVTYTKAQLIGVLSAAIDYYGATQVRHLNHLEDFGGDHPDHTASALFASAAADTAASTPSRQGYLGYANAYGAANVTGTQVTRKRTTFGVYAPFDSQIGTWDNAWITHQRLVRDDPTADGVSGTDARLFTTANDTALPAGTDTTFTICGMPFTVSSGTDLVLTAVSILFPTGTSTSGTNPLTQLVNVSLFAGASGDNYPSVYVGGGSQRGGFTAGTRAAIPLIRPVVLDPSQKYWVNAIFRGGRYARQASKFTSAGVTNGRLATPASTSSAGNNSYSQGESAFGSFFPTSVYQDPWYGLDVVVRDAEAAVDATVTIPAPAAVTLAALAPSIAVPATVAVPTPAPVATDALAPTVTAAVNIAAPTAALTLTAPAPAATGGTAGTVAVPNPATLTITAPAPTVTGGSSDQIVAVPAPAALTLTAPTPAVSNGTSPTGRDITITAGPITGGWAASGPATGWLTDPTIPITGDQWTADPPTGGWTATQPTG